MGKLSTVGPRKKGMVWAYFTRHGLGNGKCNLCSKLISITSGSTHNLYRHLRRIHRNIVVDGYSALYSEREPEQPVICINIPSETSTIAESQQSQINPQLYPKVELSTVNGILHKTFTGKPNELDFCLVEAIVKNYLPVQIVESPHFKKFVTKLNKSYQLPSVATVSEELIPRIYTSAKEKIRNYLQDIAACSICIDSWTTTSDVTYISVTTHYINNELELKSSLLDCFQCEQQSSAESIADELQRVILEWGIDSKIVAIVSDNDPNVRETIGGTGWEHIPCFSHTLNDVVICGLEEVNYLLMKVQSLVDFFMGSPQAYEKLWSMQVELGEMPLALEKGIKTRWNTTYNMLSRILEVKDSLVTTIAIHYPHLENLTSDDLCLIGEICELLKMFKDVNEEICKEGEVTVSKIMLLTQALWKYCTKFLSRKDISETVHRVGKKLLEALKNKFERIEENDIYAEATFLDPRFKRYGFISEEHFDRIKKTVISKANGRVSPNNKQTPGNVKVVMESANNSSSIWDDFDNSVSDVVKNANATAAGSIEVDKYLTEPLLVRHGNPLSWWLEKKKDYPRLFEIAKARLCIVGVSTQRFSNVGQTNLDRHNCISGNEASKILFLNGNL